MRGTSPEVAVQPGSVIRIRDMFTRGRALLLGLEIMSPCKEPLVVGCSLRTERGEIIDRPVRLLHRKGNVIWGQERVSDKFAYSVKTEVLGWQGHIIFALYSDLSMRERLADTGWEAWTSMNIYGCSMAGIENQDEQIAFTFGTHYIRAKSTWEDPETRMSINSWSLNRAFRKFFRRKGN